MYAQLAMAALQAGKSGGGAQASPVNYTTTTKTASDFDFSGFTVATGKATAAPRITTAGASDALETFADSLPGGLSPLVLLALVGLGMVAVTRLGK